MHHSVLWQKSVVQVRFYITYVIWNKKCEPDSSRHYVNHTCLESKVNYKHPNKWFYNHSFFPDNRWRWRKSVFHHVLAENLLILYKELFTNIIGKVFLFLHCLFCGVFNLYFFVSHFKRLFWHSRVDLSENLKKLLLLCMYSVYINSAHYWSTNCVFNFLLIVELTLRPPNTLHLAA